MNFEPYPFEKLNNLLQNIIPNPNLTPCVLTIGEPQFETPDFIQKSLAKHTSLLQKYPKTTGEINLREAQRGFVKRRFHVELSDAEIIPTFGTREVLFNFPQFLLFNKENPVMAYTNPFYQIYEGAAILAGAHPYYLNCDADNDFIPDFDHVPAGVWDRCQLVYLCSPGNPTGAVIDQATLTQLIELAQQHDFIIASDECYSEIYFDEQQPPVGLLQAAVAAGFTDFSRCVVFHSLSKRSNAPGLRSGFVAGDATILKDFLRYRTYHGSAMPPATQSASIAAWNDEDHVIYNRKLYREKFSAVLDILSPVMNVSLPQAGFYLWAETPNSNHSAETPISDTDFARRLFDEQNVSVLPGSFLARDNNTNPGNHRIRMALVAPLEECIEAAHRIKYLIENL